MEHFQGYGSVVIVTDNRGKSYLKPLKGANIEKSVLPDAIEYVKLYEKNEMLLKDINGFDMVISPITPDSIILKDYKQRAEIEEAVRAYDRVYQRQ